MKTTTTSGSAFRRVGKSALAVGAAAGTIACLLGSLGTLPAQAEGRSPHTVVHRTAAEPAAAADAKQSVAAHEPAAQAAAHAAAVKAAEEAYHRSAEFKRIDAYYAAGYGYEDALDLAALWNSPDRNAAKFTAGAKLLAGKRLPFAPGGGFTRSYTEEQELRAFALAGYDDPESEARLASYWQVSVHDAKVKAGALALANQPIPTAASPDEGQEVEAFFAAGYDYADAVQLAALWHTATPYDAKVKAGADLLSTPAVPLPIQP